jgi:hypothetical protein
MFCFYFLFLKHLVFTLFALLKDSLVVGLVSPPMDHQVDHTTN